LDAEEFEPDVDCDIEFRYLHSYNGVTIYGRHVTIAVSAFTGDVTLVFQHIPERIDFPDIGESVGEPQLMEFVHSLRLELFPESTPEDVHIHGMDWVISAGYWQDGEFHPWEGGGPKARLAHAVAIGGRRKDVVILLIDCETLQILAAE
jgi:hypothetical protein